MEMSNWEIADKYTILKIKLEKGLDCEEQFRLFEKEIEHIDKDLLKDLYEINLEMWLHEEVLTMVIASEDYHRVGLLYASLRDLTNQRTAAKNRIAEKYDKFRELKKY